MIEHFWPRANPRLFPFEKHKTDSTDLYVGNHVMLVYTPAGMKRAARILVDALHIPLALYATLTGVVTPHLGGDDHLTIEAGSRELVFDLYIEHPSAEAVRELRAIGFDMSPHKTGAYSVFEQRVRDNPAPAGWTEHFWIYRGYIDLVWGEPAPAPQPRVLRLSFREKTRKFRFEVNSPEFRGIVYLKPNGKPASRSPFNDRIPDMLTRFREKVREDPDILRRLGMAGYVQLTGMEAS